MNLWRRIRRWFQRRDLEQVVWNHWVPPHNSVQSWSVGPDRCYYCLLHVNSEMFERPCSRRRPESMELA